jgi:uncharacterized Zn-binding protein involved in type VI secretion
MPGFILHQGAQVLCMHGGQAVPTAPVPRVTVAGMAVTTQAPPYSVAGCPFVPPAGTGPCVTAQWVTGSTRVKVNGVPVLLFDSQAVCAPTGTGVVVVMAQQRVTAV